MEQMELEETKVEHNTPLTQSQVKKAVDKFNQ